MRGAACFRGNDISVYNRIFRLMSRFSGFTLGKRKEERQPLPPPAGAAAVPSRKKTYQDEERQAMILIVKL